MGSKTKSSAKHGRNRKSGQNTVYKAEHRREKGHVNRIRSHLRRFGTGDLVACEAIVRFAGLVGLEHLRKAQNVVAELRKRERA